MGSSSKDMVNNRVTDSREDMVGHLKVKAATTWVKDKGHGIMRSSSNIFLFLRKSLLPNHNRLTGVNNQEDTMDNSLNLRQCTFNNLNKRREDLEQEQDAVLV
jgi:hypothetical protein